MKLKLAPNEQRRWIQHLINHLFVHQDMPLLHHQVSIITQRLCYTRERACHYRRTHCLYVENCVSRSLFVRKWPTRAWIRVCGLQQLIAWCGWACHSLLSILIRAEASFSLILLFCYVPLQRPYFYIRSWIDIFGQHLYLHFSGRVPEGTSHEREIDRERSST